MPTIKIGPFFSVIMTSVPFSIFLLELACQISPLYSTYPLFFGLIFSVTLAISPINSPIAGFFLLIYTTLYKANARKIPNTTEGTITDAIIVF